MLLANIGLVNWHHYVLLDIGVEGDAIGVVGRNGQGKSTVIDAMQVLMSGGDATIKLNKRASTETSGPRRTIRSYCLGSTSADKFKRQESSTYLLASFVDPQGKKQPVTLMLAFSAKESESKHTIVTRAIIKGAILTAADIKTVNEDGKAVIETWETIRQRVIRLVESRNGKIEEYRSSHREFVREYMHATFYKNRSHAQDQFQKNFINSIAFDTTSSANLFIQNSLLGQNNIDIHSLREQWKRFHDLYELTKIIKKQIEQLIKLDNMNTAYLKAKVAVAQEEAFAAISKAEHARQENKRLKRQFRDEIIKRDADTEKASNLKNLIEGMRQEVNSIANQKNSVQNVDRKARLMGEVTSHGHEIQKAMAPIFGSEGILKSAVKLHKSIDRTKFGGSEVLMTLDNLVSITGNDPSATKMPDDVVELSQALSSFSTNIEDFSMEMDAVVQEQAATIVRLKNENNELDQTIAKLEKNTLALDRDTIGFMQILSENGIESSVFCEAVEVEDETWRDAVEGYLNKYRETIFVNVSDNEKASSLLSGNRKKFPHTLLANVRKLSQRTARVEKGTLASVLSTSDPIVQSFIEFRVGRVQLAESTLDFTKPGNWITSGGVYDDGSVTSIVSVREQKIGKGGIEQRLKASRKRKETLDLELRTALGTSAGVNSVQKTATRLKELFAAIDDLSAAIEQVRSFVDERLKLIDACNAELDVIASQDTSSYDDEMKTLNNEIRDLSIERDKIIADISTHGRVAEEAEKKIGGGDMTTGSNASLVASRAKMQVVLKNMSDVEKRDVFLLYIQRRRLKRPGDIHISSSNEVSNLRIATLEAANETKAMAVSTIALLEDGDLFEDGIDLDTNVITWTRETLERLRDVTLVDHEDALRRATDSAMDTFKSGYINELHARFQTMEAELKAINSILKNYPFLDEIYTIKATKAVAYEPFHEVVEKMREMEYATTGGGLLVGLIDDPKAILEAMESVKHMLFNEESNLEDFIDYRKYWTFDIEIVNPVTKDKNTFSNRKATGSGGEQQTPYYMLMMCALSSTYYGGAYRPNRPGEGGMCLAIFDEAFNNMDGKVARLIFDFGKRLGLQCMYCGPSDKKPLMQENCGTVLSVFKSSDGNQTQIVREKVKAQLQEELLKIDPTRMSDERVMELSKQYEYV